jgi:hypothetical protein
MAQYNFLRVGQDHIIQVTLCALLTAQTAKPRNFIKRMEQVVVYNIFIIFLNDIMLAASTPL